MKKLWAVIVLSACSFWLEAEVKLVQNVSYVDEHDTDEYRQQRCKLDLYLPNSAKASAVLIWFHGGGLRAGDKTHEKEIVPIALKFAEHGIAFIAVNYRLSPKAQYPAYVDDASASIQWVIEHISDYNFLKNKVFVGGHSAGGYLTLMSTFKNASTDKCGLKVDAIAGIIPVSGQTVTHTTVRKELGLPETAVVCDERAPLYHLPKLNRKSLIIAADSDYFMRLEENQLLYAAVKVKSSPLSEFLCVQNRTHVSVMTEMATVGDPAFEAVLAFIEKTSL